MVGLKSTSPAKAGAYTYTSGTGALVQIFQKEGLKGLYRGIWPNLLKVSPSQAVSFLCVVPLYPSVPSRFWGRA